MQIFPLTSLLSAKATETTHCKRTYIRIFPVTLLNAANRSCSCLFWGCWRKRGCLLLLDYFTPTQPTSTVGIRRWGQSNMRVCSQRPISVLKGEDAAAASWLVAAKQQRCTKSAAVWGQKDFSESYQSVRLALLSSPWFSWICIHFNVSRINCSYFSSIYLLLSQNKVAKLCVF